MNYDQTAMPAGYDAGRSYAPHVLRKWLEIVGKHAPGKVSRILDLGCGTGRYSLALADRFGADVEAIDPSARMLEQARQKPHARVRFQQAPGEDVPLRDGSVDLVFMSMVFHHFEDPERVTRECRRVLSPGGRVCLRAGTREQVPTYPYVRFFERSAAILHDLLQPSTFIESAFAHAGFACAAHELVESEVAGSWDHYAEKLSHRADSVLARLGDEEFRAGLARARSYALEHAGSDPVIELVDFFAFRAA